MSDHRSCQEMMNQSTIAEVSHLPWDSEFFGFQVGRFDIREADLVLAENALAKAKEDGFRLIYLSVESGNPELSHEYSGVFGKAIDLKTTFICKLEGSLVDQQILKFAGEDGVYLMEKEVGTAGIELEKLAILSGTESRFFKDPKIPIGKAQEMYRIWINKCTERELADSVFVAYSRCHEVIGFITVKHFIGSSNIGLFAVDQQWQGKKIGSRLLNAVANSAIVHKNTKITVVTQGSNFGASRAYLKNGYTVHNNQHLFHMWFQ